jgi:hypothetical protein
MIEWNVPAREKNVILYGTDTRMLRRFVVIYLKLAQIINEYLFSENVSENARNSAPTKPKSPYLTPT